MSVNGPQAFRRPFAPGRDVLDVGCGTGRVTEAVLELVRGGRVLAIVWGTALGSGARKG